MTPSFRAAAVTALLMLGGCAAKTPVATSRPDTAKIVDAIKTDEVHWNDDWKSGDAARVAAHFAPGALYAIAGEAPLTGTPAITAGVQRAMDDKTFALSFVSDKVFVATSGDLAVSRGGYVVTATDPTTGSAATEKGTFVTVYRPQPRDGWKAVWEVTAPAAAAAPVKEAAR
ncbi:MAG: DUF4440 domain-containing protein [Caulobacteraceae bacterium]